MEYGMRPVSRHGHGLDLPSRLAFVAQPLLPYLKKLKLRRRGRRNYRPHDILLPEGFVAELIAGDLSSPVHCCFDDQGMAYISECGHKTDSPPRIVKFDLSGGSRRAVIELPAERWTKTGALTGAAWR